MPMRSSCFAAVTLGPELYRTTRSGFRAATASTFGGMPSPTPMAKRISVNEGRSETILWDGPTAGRPDGPQLARKRTKRRVRFTIPPARELHGGANEDVSWLRANRLAFPGFPSGIEPITACPLQWRGRAGLTPASVTPVREIDD